MQNRTEAQGTEKYQLNIFVAYEDQETAKKALKVYDELVSAISHDTEVMGDIWDLKSLSHPRSQQRALRSASEAKLIIFANHEENELPIETRTWISSWLSKKNDSTAVILLNNRRQDATSISDSFASFLSEASRVNGSTYFQRDSVSSALDKDNLMLKQSNIR